jgi:hypothetical protein
MRLASFATSFLVVALGACTTEARRLGDALDRARAEVLDIRPSAALDGLRVETARGDASTPTRGGGGDARDVDYGAVLARHGTALRALGVLSGDDLVELDRSLVRGGFEVTAAFACPEDGRIVVRSAEDATQDVLVHELAHVASWRAGWSRDIGERLYVARPAARDLRWFDVDALLAAWALDEGDAEFTTWIARGRRTGGSAEAARLRGSRTAVDLDHTGPRLKGPIRVTLATGTVLSVAAGETARLPSTELSSVLAYFAYEAAPNAFATIDGDGDTTEDVLEARWSAPRLRTRDLLHLAAGRRPPTSPSPGWAGTIAAEPNVEGATRVGGLLLRCALARRWGATPGSADRLALALADDLVVEMQGGDVAWITLWDDVASATEFESIRLRVAGTGREQVQRSGRRVIAGAARPVEQLLRLMQRTAW